ncbi:MAG: hypothetical protein WBB57_03460 [Mycobacterium sp.]
MVTADHGQQISAVGIGSAHHPGVGAHVEEMWPLRVGLDGELGAQRRHLGQHAQPFAPLTVIGGVFEDRAREVGQHLLDEPPGFEDRRGVFVANSFHGET